MRTQWVTASGHGCARAGDDGTGVGGLQGSDGTEVFGARRFRHSREEG